MPFPPLIARCIHICLPSFAPIVAHSSLKAHCTCPKRRRFTVTLACLHPQVSDLVTVHSKDSRPSPKTAYSASAEPVNAVAMPRPLDWASLVYTPGTVSRKCVILTHMNVLAPVAGMCLGLDGRRQVVNDKDVYMSILNLADAFEVTMQGLMMSCGASIAYAGPGNDIQKLVDVDMAVLRPTVVGAVPEVCRRMYSKIKAAVAKKGALSRIMYKSSMKSHTAHVSRGSRGTVLDSSVFKSLRDEFGGRLQLVVTNGVPLSESLHCDLICVLGCTVLQAYSLAECGGIVMCMPVSLWSTGTVGGPLPSCEVKLIDTATYKVSPEPQLPNFGPESNGSHTQDRRM